MNLDNTKSAKEYIAESYSAELNAIQEKNKLMETPSSIIEKEKISHTLELAEEIIKMDILNEETTKEYTKLNSMIQAKKDEIRKLYGIEVTKDGLQAVKSAMKSVEDGLSEYIKANQEEFSKALADEMEVVKAEIKSAEEETNKKVDAINEEISSLKESNRKETQREKAEYDYNLKRTRKQQSEARVKEIAEREKAMSAKEEEVNNRRKSAEDALAEITELQAKVDDIENQLNTAREKGAEEKSKELGREYGYKTAMAEQESKFQITKLQKEYDRLNDKYKAVLAENASLSAKLDKCNAESRQLATDTVKSTGGINILNTENGQNGKK
ncbi:MAG: hypothetical protein K2J39_01475 [Ruminococcus sp.]|nr:hypothetical protein [Ruminococcus sp.]